MGWAAVIIGVDREGSGSQLGQFPPHPGGHLAISRDLEMLLTPSRDRAGMLLAICNAWDPLITNNYPPRRSIA